jgi:hypothetical protein
LQKIRDDWTHTVSETHGKAHNQLERINKIHVEVHIYSKAQNRKKVRSGWFGVWFWILRLLLVLALILLLFIWI